MALSDLPSTELLRTYGKRLAELARAETLELVGIAQLLAVVVETAGSRVACPKRLPS